MISYKISLQAYTKLTTSAVNRCSILCFPNKHQIPSLRSCWWCGWGRSFGFQDAHHFDRRPKLSPPHLLFSDEVFCKQWFHSIIFSPRSGVYWRWRWRWLCGLRKFTMSVQCFHEINTKNLPTSFLINFQVIHKLWNFGGRQPQLESMKAFS